MARKKEVLPEYKTVIHNGSEYYRTRIKDADGKRVAVYGSTREELHKKVKAVQKEIDNITFCRENPTVKEYCEKWLLMKSATIKPQTLQGYERTMRKYIIEPIGDMYMDEVTLDDLKLLMVPVSKMSSGVYSKVNMLVKCIFYSAEANQLIENNPSATLSAKGGKAQNKKEALSDEQVNTLLNTVKNLPPYLFVMIGLYSGLRREEILGLQWDCVFLDCATPYIAVRRAWRSVKNRPVISSELKSPAAKRDIPIPKCLIDILKEAKEKSISDFVISDSKGEPLSYSQFQRVWKYIEVRTAKERKYYKYVNGQKVVCTIYPELGSHQKNNPKLIYSLDFDVTPHQLRHTYITNLIYLGVDPKTVQYLAGHENSKITIDIYAKVKYNKPNELIGIVNKAFK
ncbi:MAG: site-specific integrase [Clostridia bacterium]|nr:site-specific integrase [Clostridia bacterium]MBQ3427755.1 site-specific integrase [Clostridia bacterium]